MMIYLSCDSTQLDLYKLVVEMQINVAQFELVQKKVPMENRYCLTWRQWPAASSFLVASISNQTGTYNSE